MVNLRHLAQSSVVLGVGLLAGGSLGAQNLQNFVAVTPCRILDTRLANGPLGGPSMAGNTTRSFPFPSACGLPATAAAYSINVTVVPPKDGTLGYLTIFPTGSAQPTVSTLNDFQGDIVANAAVVPAGTNGSVTIFVTDNTDVIVDVNGYFISNTSSANNTSVGQGALPFASGSQNTGVGFGSLGNNASGNYNTALGSNSLSANSTGSGNTALGQGSIASNTTGTFNTGVGYGALFSESTAANNVAIGYQAMNGGTGDTNVAVGAQALLGVTGAGNVAVGYQAGSSVTNGSNNIEIGNFGLAADNNVIRIGTVTRQSAMYVAGVYGTNVTQGAPVVVDVNGQIGVVLSSRRYKEDIQPMADSSDRLMQLEPVTFRYKQASSDGSQNLQYGLIAEQVAAVFPELAVYNKDGQVETLQYLQLPALLLNEIQKEHRTIQDLEARIASLEQLLKASAAAKH